MATKADLTPLATKADAATNPDGDLEQLPGAGVDLFDGRGAKGKKQTNQRDRFQRPACKQRDRGWAVFDERRARGRSRWKRLRLKTLRRFGHLCVVCRQQGRTVGATDVDHIQPAAGDESLFYAGANLQALCRECHELKNPP